MEDGITEGGNPCPGLCVLNSSSCSAFATKVRLTIFRGMHNILETSIESRCNAAIASMRSMELRGRSGQASRCPAWGAVSRAVQDKHGQAQYR
jgi:hypothetical protein